MKSPLLQSLFDDAEPRPLSISELNSKVRAELERRFSSVWIEGEISDFIEANSGHWYFTLRDQFSQLKAACFRGSNYRIRFKPFDGLQVRVRGNLSVYEPRGEYQIIAETLDPVGEGALRIAFEQLKLRLGQEGLFDEALKRPLPVFPQKIGIITSPDGAAIHDILNVLSRRTRSISIVLIPSRVQGEGAGDEIAEAIGIANEFNRGAAEKIDVLIVGRGGGSSEDLWAFNDERLARAIRHSAIPVISAVGHETDFTIADFVSDMRAPTPSAAAEIVAMSEDQLESYLRQQEEDMLQILNFKILNARTELQSLVHSQVFAEFPLRIKGWRYDAAGMNSALMDAFSEKLRSAGKNLDALTGRLSPIRLAASVSENQKRLALIRQRKISATLNLLKSKKERMKIGMASLDALSPLSVLKRGFSLAQAEDGTILTDALQVEAGEKVQIRLSNGKLKAEVLSRESN